MSVPTPKPAPSKKKQITLSHLQHRGKRCIRLDFEYDHGLIEVVKQMPGAKWSKTHGCWYILNNKVNLKQLFNAVKGLAWIDGKRFFKTGTGGKGRSTGNVSRKPVIKKLTEEQQKAVEWYRKWMQSKGYSINTINTYSSILEVFFTFIGNRLVRDANNNDVIYFNSEWIIKNKRSESYQRQAVNAIKLLYAQIGGHSMKVKKLERVKKAKRLPEVLSYKETQRLFDSYTNQKHKTMMVLTYACGLRRSEVLNLRWKDIDRHRMVLYVRFGKGKKDRQVILPQTILTVLEDYWKKEKTKDYVFEGQKKETYTGQSMAKVLKQGLARAGIKKNITLHGLRHSYATHSVEQGTDVSMLQQLLGHKSIKTTSGYLHISKRNLHDVKNPIDNFKL